MIKKCKNCHHFRLKVWGVDMMECQKCQFITTKAGLLLPPETQHYVLVVEQREYPDDGPMVFETQLSHASALETRERIEKYNYSRFGQHRLARLQYIEEWE